MRWRIAIDISWNLIFEGQQTHSWLLKTCHIINMVKDCFVSYHPPLTVCPTPNTCPKPVKIKTAGRRNQHLPHVLQRRPQMPRPLRWIYQDATALLLLREAQAYSGAGRPATWQKPSLPSKLPMAAGKRRSKSPNIRWTSATHPCSSLEEPK